jgi:hypothetical protein
MNCGRSLIITKKIMMKTSKKTSEVTSKNWKRIFKEIKPMS